MPPWPAIYRAVKLCVCVLLLSMLGLFHYTVTHHNHPYSAALTVDDRLSRSVGQWRAAEEGGKLQRVLTSSTYSGDSHREAAAQEESGAIEALLEIRELEAERPSEPEQAAGGITVGSEISAKSATLSETSAKSATLSEISTKSTTLSETSASLSKAIHRPKPLPQLDIDALFRFSNDTPFSPLTDSRAKPIRSKHAKLVQSSAMLAPRTPGGGYVITTKVYEQQTMASGNLLQLQCWASMLNMSLVTPFMRQSYVLTPLDEARHKSYLSFWDTFNEAHWQEHAQSHGYLPQVEWEEWVKRGPRQLIVVQVKYPLLSAVKAKRKQGIEFPHPHSGEDYKKGCEFKFVSGKSLQSLRAKGFSIARKVCFNFIKGDGFTFKEFSEHIFGNFHPGDVSVIFDQWRGLNEAQRVLIMEKICHEDHPFREKVKLSNRLISDAQNYKEKFLGPGDYIAVMTRFEMTGLTRQKQVDNDMHAEIPLCIEKTLSQLEQLRAETGIESTFLSTDVGKYGSSSFSKKKYYNHFHELTQFVQRVYKDRMVLADVEHTLEQVSRTRDSGYIASLQQLIVTRARCILFMGGGSFQRHTLHMYQDLHPRKADQCVHVVESCTSPNRPIT